jgi:hypothetical protein
MMVVAVVMPVVVMMTMLVIMVMPVVFAAIRGDGQLTIEIRGDLFLHQSVGKPGAHGDAMMGEVGHGTVANPASNHHFDTLLAQPTRERAGLVFGRRQHVHLLRDPLIWVHLDHGELAAAAEVAVQATVFMWDGNFHK